MSMFSFRTPTTVGDAGEKAANGPALPAGRFAFARPEASAKPDERDASSKSAPVHKTGLDAPSHAPPPPPQPTGLGGGGGEAEDAPSTSARRATTPTTTLKTQAPTNKMGLGGLGAGSARGGSRKEATRKGQDAPAMKLFNSANSPAPKPQAPLSSSSMQKKSGKKGAGGAGGGGARSSSSGKKGESSKAVPAETEDDRDALTAMVLGEADFNEGSQWDTRIWKTLELATQVEHVAKDTAEDHEALAEQADMHSCLATAHNVELAFASPIDSDTILRTLATYEMLLMELEV